MWAAKNIDYNYFPFGDVTSDSVEKMEKKQKIQINLKLRKKWRSNIYFKAFEKRERDARMKPYFKTVEKFIDNISDKDLETVTNYVISKFGNKWYFKIK